MPERQVGPRATRRPTSPLAPGRRGGAALALTAALLAVLTGACTAQAPQDGAPEAGRLRVAASLFPLQDIVRHVAGARADVVVVLPAGASPHTFDLAPSDLARVSGARAVFRIGHGLDDWAIRAIGEAGEAQDVLVDAGIALRQGAEEDEHQGEEEHPEGTAGPEEAEHAAEQEPGGIDPHYWLVAANGAVIARNVAATMAELDPDGAEAYRANARAYATELEGLDRRLADEAAALADRRIATFHDAWFYFAAAYGLEVVATFEPSGGREPSPAWVRDFQDGVRDAGVDVVFAEPQSSTRALEAIARDLGVRIAMLDDIGGPDVPGRSSYTELLAWNMEQIRQAKAGAGGG